MAYRPVPMVVDDYYSYVYPIVPIEPIEFKLTIKFSNYHLESPEGICSFIASVSPPLSHLPLTDTHIKSGTDNIRCKCFRVFSSQQPIQAHYCVGCRRVTICLCLQTQVIQQ